MAILRTVAGSITYSEFDTDSSIILQNITESNLETTLVIWHNVLD